jgi:serine/threonine-protein kinase
MAPEQAVGRTDRMSPATDVWALGVILYELLTGHRPFAGPTREDLVRQICHTSPVPLRKRCPHLPWQLETVCLHCLRKGPERRYASAQALAEDLHRWMAGEPIQARKAGLVERSGSSRGARCAAVRCSPPCHSSPALR